MVTLPNPLERHINTPHPYTQFLETHQDIIQTKIFIDNELCGFIHLYNEPPSINILQNRFPFLPKKLIAKALRCFKPLTKYTHPLPLQDVPIPSARTTMSTNSKTHIITWNASFLNTKLPSLHNLTSNLRTPSALIHIQETKLTTTESTKYI